MSPLITNKGICWECYFASTVNVLLAWEGMEHICFSYEFRMLCKLFFFIGSQCAVQAIFLHRKSVCCASYRSS
jgi:hypothetical protein